MPQSFETAEDLDARSEWNDLRPRPTQPQLFTLNDSSTADVTLRDAVYFKGLSTNLNPAIP